MLNRLRSWLQKRHFEREARRAVKGVFAAPELLRGTSLGPHHSSRVVLLDHEVANGRVVRAWFGILRHPRPYAFSRQSHKVVELYSYDLRAGSVTRVQGINLTRLRGDDAD